MVSYEAILILFGFSTYFIIIRIILNNYPEIDFGLPQILVGSVGAMLGLAFAVLLGFSTSYVYSLFSGRKSAKVFVSYSSKDSAFTRRLTRDLSANAFEILDNREEWRVGDNYKEKVSASISNADIFIIILSRNTYDSKWTKYELDDALNKGKRIFPILAEDVDLPANLSALKYANLTTSYEKGLALLIKSLRNEN